MTTIGMESSCALATPVMTFVMPGAACSIVCIIYTIYTYCASILGQIIPAARRLVRQVIISSMVLLYFSAAISFSLSAMAWYPLKKLQSTGVFVSFRSGSSALMDTWLMTMAS